MAFKIAEPCHEDWSKMTSTEKGAFCKIFAIMTSKFDQFQTTCTNIFNFDCNDGN